MVTVTAFNTFIVTSYTILCKNPPTCKSVNNVIINKTVDLVISQTVQILYFFIKFAAYTVVTLFVAVFQFTNSIAHEISLKGIMGVCCLNSDGVLRCFIRLK